MDSQDIPQKQSEESVTFTIRKSTRNVFVAKILILLVLSILGGHFYTISSARQYEKGRELTQEKYLEKFDDYKASLLRAKQRNSLVFSTFTTLITMVIFIGSYELTALIVGFALGKVIKK